MLLDYKNCCSFGSKKEYLYWLNCHVVYTRYIRRNNTQILTSKYNRQSKKPLSLALIAHCPTLVVSGFTIKKRPDIRCIIFFKIHLQCMHGWLWPKIGHRRKVIVYFKINLLFTVFGYLLQFNVWFIQEDNEKFYGRRYWEIWRRAFQKLFEFGHFRLSKNQNRLSY